MRLFVYMLLMTALLNALLQIYSSKIRIVLNFACRLQTIQHLKFGLLLITFSKIFHFNKYFNFFFRTTTFFLTYQVAYS